MATVAFAPTLNRRISLAEIDTAVSARLGPTRIPGNAQPACFNRQVAISRAACWQMEHHRDRAFLQRSRPFNSVCHGIQRIESLRESNSEVDALLAELKLRICGDAADATIDNNDDIDAGEHSRVGLDELADLVAARICAYLEKRLQNQFDGEVTCLPQSRK